VSSTGQPQVAWIAIDAGAVVVAADGSEIGKVKEVAGDEEHDIFDGLVVSHSRLGGDRYVASERVKGIWPDRVETDLSPQEAEGMPAYRESKTTEWHADGGGLGTRLRLALRDLFGRRR
jgi:sporulation protein YlmC with PRC-barrel domain